MHMNEGWLVKETAGPRTEDLVRTILQEIDEKSRSVTTQLEAEARNTMQACSQRQAIRRGWFQSSIGLACDGEKETWYVTEVREVAPHWAISTFSPGQRGLAILLRACEMRR